MLYEKRWRASAMPFSCQKETFLWENNYTSVHPVSLYHFVLYSQSGLSPAREDKVVPLPSGHVLTTCSWEKQEFDSWPILLFSTFNSPFGEPIRFSAAASLERFFFKKKPSLITKWRNGVAFPPPLTIPAFEISIWGACVWFKLLCLSSCPRRMWKHLWKVRRILEHMHKLHRECTKSNSS